jgi:hypothetical protein
LFRSSLQSQAASDPARREWTFELLLKFVRGAQKIIQLFCRKDLKYPPTAVGGI